MSSTAISLNEPSTVPTLHLVPEEPTVTKIEKFATTGYTPQQFIALIKKETPVMGVLARILVTSEMATKILDLNTHNRKIKKRLTTNYTQSMSTGHWLDAGNTVKVSRTYRLLDGQHSLLACEASGVPVIFTFLLGLDDKTFAVMDNNQPRTGGDTLYVGGVTDHSNTTAQAISQVIKIKARGSLTLRLKGGKVDNQTYAAWTEDPRRINAMKRAVDIAVVEYYTPKSILSRGTWAALQYLFNEKSREDAEFFLTGLATGEGLYKGNKTAAIYHLRNKLEKFARKDELFEGKALAVKYSYIITAWNHYRANEVIDKLVLNKKETAIPKIL